MKTRRDSQKGESESSARMESQEGEPERRRARGEIIPIPGSWILQVGFEVFGKIEFSVLGGLRIEVEME